MSVPVYLSCGVISEKLDYNIGVIVVLFSDFFYIL